MLFDLGLSFKNTFIPPEKKLRLIVQQLNGIVNKIWCYDFITTGIGVQTNQIEIYAKVSH